MSNLPVPRDPITTAIEKSIEEAATAAKEYLSPLLSQGLEAAGGLVGDTVNYWRFKNKIRLVLRMKALLESKGIKPKSLLPKTVWPILDGGSLEDTTEMQDKWAALLANAATAPNCVSPSFPKILSELAPLDAAVLDWISSETSSHNPESPITLRKALTVFENTIEEMLLVVFNLERQNLIMSSDYLPGITEDDPQFMHLQLSPFGAAFVRACKPPECT